MKEKVPPQVVHESETQRQFVRARLPATLELRDAGTYRVRDLSVGGLAFHHEDAGFRRGDKLSGTLSVDFESIAISIPVAFVVGRVGDDTCAGEFDDLDPEALASLRHLISAYLSGEIIGAGDVVHTLNRENFTSARGGGKGGPGGMGRTARARAYIGTAASFVIGVFALSYVASNLYDLLFVTSSSVAEVEGASYSITMPREGTFRSLVAEGKMVEKGAPLGTFETPMLEIVRNEALAANLSPDRVKELLENTVRGTVTSPCNCRVQRQFTGDGQFVAKGQPVFRLVDMDEEPVVIARFGYKRMGELQPGRSVRVSVSGTDRNLNGQITRVSHARGAASSGAILEVEIKTEQPLSPELISRPAQVTMMTPSFMPRLDALGPDPLPKNLAMASSE